MERFPTREDPYPMGSKPLSKVKRKIKYGRDMNEFFFLTL